MQDEKIIAKDALMVITEAKGIVIQNDDDWGRADKFLVVLKGMMKRLDEAYDEVISASHKAWKAALSKKAQYYDPVDREYKFLKSKMGEYKKQKEIERKLEEARQLKEAIKQAEDQKLAEAEAFPENADAILEEPVTVAPVVVPNDLKSETRFRTIWNCEIVDLSLLVKSVADGTAPLEAVCANEKYLRDLASVQKEKMNIPGVRAFSKLV